MGNISIVTAFYDIGRGDWTPDKGLPHYLQRSTDTYIERFTHLTKLDNELIVVTTPDIGKRLKEINNKVKIVEYDPFTVFSTESNKIIGIQESVAYKQLIHPSQIKNPEYWSHKYVLVNLLKSHFVSLAINQGLVTNDMVAWLDFGYCRSEETLPKSLTWSYDFDPTKIHLFAYKDLDPKARMEIIIATNDVHILGAKIVAHKKLWPVMENKMFSAFELLYMSGLMDDDQTLMLICAARNPELFEQHRIPDHQLGLDPFVIFKNFNLSEKI
jgi:protein YibB